MNLSKVLTRYKFSDEAKEKILSSGIKELYPPQGEAIKKGILDKKSLLMSVPTAAGKTLIAELCMLHAILHDNARCLYIAPLKALASEKYNDFKDKYASLGVNVGLAIGDADSPVRNLNKYNILIATAEKVDSLLRSKTSWLINSLSVAVLDEIHFINDGSRGPTMEILTARIKQLNPNIQILALSATVSNADEMASWLNAELVASDWRPIPLKEGVYYNERIKFDSDGTRMITEDVADDLGKLTLDTLRAEGQVLIFVNSRRSTQAVSRQISKAVAKILTPQEKIQLDDISRKVAGNSADATKICHKLADVIKCGVAFHHAGLKSNQRELVEQSFKQNLIKAISCTPTLAAGVNLPARRAIIRDCKRFESGIGQAYIPTSEYKQCAGRAGRPQYDDHGEAVIVAKSHSEVEVLFEKYIHASPEPITSKLADESALRMHILASIAGGYVHDINSMFEFIKHTFLYHQKQSENLLGLIGDIFEFLHNEKFIEQSGVRFFATPFGSLTSRLYIDPITSITIRNGLNIIAKKKNFEPIGILHLIACCPDSISLNIGKKDLEILESFASNYYDDFILTPENHIELDDFYYYLSTMKSTFFLSQWTEETKEDSLCDQFNIGPGDIYRHVDSAQRLLYAAGAIADLNKQKSLTFGLENLRTQVRHGIKEELVEVVRLKGVGRVRARQLFKKGYKKLKDFHYVSAVELGSIPQIGQNLAINIIKQVNTLSRKKAAPFK